MPPGRVATPAVGVFSWSSSSRAISNERGTSLGLSATKCYLIAQVVGFAHAMRNELCIQQEQGEAAFEQGADEQHSLREKDRGFRLIGLPWVTSWWRTTRVSCVFLLPCFDPCWFFPIVIGFQVFQCSDMMHLDAFGVSCDATV